MSKFINLLPTILFGIQIIRCTINIEIYNRLEGLESTITFLFLRKMPDADAVFHMIMCMFTFWFSIPIPEGKAAIITSKELKYLSHALTILTIIGIVIMIISGLFNMF